MAPIVFLLLLSIINPTLELDAISFARNHLKAFGYLSVDYTSLDDTNDEALVSALRTYQTFYRLNVTGRLEPYTLTSMTRPRCGVPDFPSKDPAHNITPQYSLLPGNPSHPPHRRRLTYAISTPEIVPEDSLRAALSSAFSKWSAETRFKFHEDYRVRDPDVRIGFYTRDHGDRNPFDGPRGILAHASPPRIDGRFHYDGDEQWSVNPSADQYDLESVALHEIGHLLGLGHSAVPSAVMFASFSRGDIKRVLQPDDIEGIHALYPQG